VHSLRRGRDNAPALLSFYERQKIVLIFDSKLQFIYPFAADFLARPSALGPSLSLLAVIRLGMTGLFFISNGTAEAVPDTTLVTTRSRAFPESHSVSIRAMRNLLFRDEK